MSGLVFVLWIVGGFPAAVLGEVVRADDQRIARAGRIAFALLLGVDLLIAAVVFTVGNTGLTTDATRSLWWLIAIAAGIPLALVSGLLVSRGYTGHRVVLAIATFTTAALYLVFPLDFVPPTHQLTGLGRFVHDHHLLAIAILLVPTLILLANELRWKGEVGPDPDPDRLGLHSLWRAIPRRNLVVGVLLLAVLVWIAGTNSAGMVLGLGVVLAGFGVFLWWRNRSAMRDVVRDLRPPEKPEG